MRLTRVFVEAPLATGARVTLPPEAAAHLTRVLRLDAGDDCVLVPDVATDICESEPGAIAALLDDLGQRLDDERRRQLRHKVSVRRERQRHSRPMPVNAG